MTIISQIDNLIEESIKARWNSLHPADKKILKGAGIIAGLAGSAYIGGKASDAYYKEKDFQVYKKRHNLLSKVKNESERLGIPNQAKNFDNDAEDGAYKTNKPSRIFTSKAYSNYQRSKNHLNKLREPSDDFINKGIITKTTYFPNSTIIDKTKTVEDLKKK